MADLAPLGQPFGSPSQVINVPGPLEKFPGSQLAGQSLGLGFARFLQNKKQKGLKEKDRARFEQAAQPQEGDTPDIVAQRQAQALSDSESEDFRRVLDKTLALNALRQADPTGQQQREATLGKTVAETEKLGRPDLATKGELQAQEIRRLQAIPKDQRTAEQSKSLKSLLEGQSAVNIQFGKSTASERTAIAETEASLDALGNLEALFSKSTTATGPVTGRVETAKGFFGLSSDEQENLLAATSAFTNKVIKDITGAQMSEAEATRITKQIPTILDPPARWRAKAKQTRLNLKTIQKRRSEVLKRSGIISPLTENRGSGTITNTQQGLSEAEEAEFQQLLLEQGK